MWMPLLYVVAIALVAVIVVIAAFFAVIFVVAIIGVLFGSKVAWKKRKFLVGLIPDEEMSAPEFVAGFVETGIKATLRTVRKKKSPTHENDIPIEKAHTLIKQQNAVKADVIRPKRIQNKAVDPTKKRRPKQLPENQ